MNRDAWGFVVIAFAWSWLLWLPQVLSSGGWLDLPGALSSIPGALAVFGPAVAAFVMVGRHRAREFWKRGWDWSFEKRWLAPVVLVPAVTVGATVGLLFAMGETIRWEYAAPLAMAAPLFLIIYLFNALPEEYGWRGYLLEQLQVRWQAVTASVAVGVIWGVWHLPLHFIAGTVQEIIPVWQFILQTVVLAVIYTWLYNNTQKSIPLVALFHTVANLAYALVPSWLTHTGRYIHFALLLLVAVAIVSMYGWRTLTRAKAIAPTG